MEDSTLIAISIAGFLIWILIMRAIIYNAVKSALGFNEHYVRAILRSKLKQMAKEGYTKEELKKMMDDSSEEFWNSL